MKRHFQAALLALPVLAVTVLGARLDAQSPHDAIQKFFKDYFEAKLNEEPEFATGTGHFENTGRHFALTTKSARHRRAATHREGEYAKNVTDSNSPRQSCGKAKPARKGAGLRKCRPDGSRQELAFSTVTARRFCDQQEMSLQTATGRSLP